MATVAVLRRRLSNVDAISRLDTACDNDRVLTCELDDRSTCVAIMQLRKLDSYSYRLIAEVDVDVDAGRNLLTLTPSEGIPVATITVPYDGLHIECINDLNLDPNRNENQHTEERESVRIRSCKHIETFIRAWMYDAKFTQPPSDPNITFIPLKARYDMHDFPFIVTPWMARAQTQ